MTTPSCDGAQSGRSNESAHGETDAHSSKIGKLVRYKKTDILQFVEAHRSESVTALGEMLTELGAGD